MPNIVLYLITCVIWGSTWLAIHYQVLFVEPTWSVFFRFASAGIILLAICLLKRVPLKFSSRLHLFMLTQGLTLFSISYIFVYISESHLVSGFVSILSAMTLVFNIINARIFLGTPIRPEVIFGCLLGIIGLVVIFTPDLVGKTNTSLLNSSGIIGIIAAVLGSLFSSFGNIISKHVQDHAMPVLQANTFGMLYGAIFTAIIALVIHAPFKFSFDPVYLSSLAYLSIFGSVIAFSCYIKLIGKVGPERVAYVAIVTPLLAMILSTFFENFHWAWYDFVGLGLALLGNILVLAKRQ